MIAFVVEGPSEEAALGTVMSEYFSGSEVKFTVVHGDITLKDYVSMDGILKKIKEQIDSVKKKYRYETEDFIKIIHLTDTDGVFIEDGDIFPGSQDTIEYFTDHIETPHIESTSKRNHRKADILLKLRRTGKINGIPYKIYFNSCNLEHVLYNTLEDFTDEDYDELQQLLEKFDGGRDGLLDNLTTIGTKTNFLQTTKTRLEDQELALTEQIHNVVDVDMAEAITEFSWAQYAYNAALKIGTSILTPSFIDFMG